MFLNDVTERDPMFFDVIKDSLIRMDSVFPGLSDSRFILLCVLAAITAFSLILVIYFSIKKRMCPVTGIMTVVFASVIVLLCIFYPDVDMLYAHPSGDPSEKVNDFLNAVSEGDIPGAYGILYGETETGAQCSGEYYELLSENFSYAYNGEMTVRDLRATVPVRIVYADLTEIPARIDTCFASELDLIVQNHPRKDVYKSDDSYMEWVVEEAYDGAVSDALSDLSI